VLVNVSMLIYIYIYIYIYFMRISFNGNLVTLRTFSAIDYNKLLRKVSATRCN